MKSNFGPQMATAVIDTPFSVDLLCGIGCQETAYVWIGFIGKLSAQTVIERCVFDASGDAHGTTRHAFPTNTAAFRAKFGDDFTNTLIAEANATRKLRGMSDTSWVYKGYGLFQYDLQYVLSDEAFFRDKQWYDFDTCLAKAVGELTKKYAITHELWSAVKAYNGSGPAADAYSANVKQFTAWAAEASA
jgi:hypothetical protein